MQVQVLQQPKVMQQKNQNKKQVLDDQTVNTNFWEDQDKKQQQCQHEHDQTHKQKGQQHLQEHNDQNDKLLNEHKHKDLMMHLKKINK